jgi:ActR/RegA family two-component response regulator
MQKLLLVEDDPNLQFTIQTALEAQGYAVDAVSTTGEAIERLNENAYPIVLTDIYIDERTGLDVLDAAKRKDPLCAVILMTGRGTMETVMAATRGGAFEYIAKPFELDVLFDALTRAEASRNDTKPKPKEEELPESVMIGSSRPWSRSTRRWRACAHRRHRGDRGRNRHRQGTGGAHDPPLQPARASSPSCRWIAAPSRLRCWKANSSAPCAARSPAPTATASASSKPPTGARFSWTKSARSIRAFRPTCCASWSHEIRPVGASRPRRWTCA